MDTEKIINWLIEFGKSAGLKIVFALLILILGSHIAAVIVKLLNKSRLFSRLDRGVRSFISSFLRVLFEILVIVSAAVVIGIPMTSFIALLASAGLAIGLALQGALSNFAGGIMILIFKPFRAGDYIETNGDEGRVVSISVFYTTLLKRDNRRVMLPNGTLMSSKVTNYSAEDYRWLELDFPVAYSSDISAVKEELLSAARSESSVLKDPAPEVYLKKLGDSALEFKLRVWVRSDDYWTTECRLLESGKKNLDGAGIKVPFTQVDVHMEEKT